MRKREERVLFKKGKQREFLDSVINNLNCISLRGILQFGLEVSYSSLKNYYSERRLLPKKLFENFCHIAKINPADLKIKFINGNWGHVKGGKKSKR